MNKIRDLTEAHPVATLRVIFFIIYIVFLCVLNVNRIADISMASFVIGTFGAWWLARMFTTIVAFVLIKFFDWNIDHDVSYKFEINGTQVI